MKLTHNDDGKERCQSHTVGMDFGEFDIYTVEGYGETREEAFDNFMIRFNELMSELKDFEKDLHNNPIMIKVDCTGEPLED